MEVVGGYVSLKAASSGSFKGLCPFHDEKSPSFNVRANPAFYHCFGCGVGGDIYKFIQEIESVSFADAVQRVADKGRLSTEALRKEANEGSTRSRLLALNKFAADYYQAHCKQPKVRLLKTSCCLEDSNWQALGLLELAMPPRVGRILSKRRRQRVTKCRSLYLQVWPWRATRWLRSLSRAGAMADQRRKLTSAWVWRTETLRR